MSQIHIRPATDADIALILTLIHELAEFEKLTHEVKATAQGLRATVFSERPAAEVLILECEGKPAGYAIFFTSFSTFLARPGIYLEDLYVRPEFRSRGIGGEALKYLARLVVERGGGRLEWSVLNWNKRAWEFYAELGAQPLEGWTTHRLTGQELERLAGR